MSNLPYLYKFINNITGKWYVGSRTSSKCYPDDEYNTSSKIVKPKILAQPELWTKQILCVGTRKYILEMEAKLLQHLNAAQDPESYNLQNQDGYVISEYQKSRKGISFTEQHRKNLSKSGLGRKVSDETKQKISQANKGKLLGRTSAFKGKKHTPEVAEKYRNSLKKYRESGNCPRTGKTHTAETKQKMSMTKLAALKKQCLHCGVFAKEGMYARWHGDNCRRQNP